MYTFVGLFRLGWLTNFLSHSVIAGFMSGASVIIALSQVHTLNYSHVGFGKAWLQCVAVG